MRTLYVGRRRPLISAEHIPDLGVADREVLRNPVGRLAYFRALADNRHQPRQIILQHALAIESEDKKRRQDKPRDLGVVEATKTSDGTPGPVLLSHHK